MSGTEVQTVNLIPSELPTDVPKIRNTELKLIHNESIHLLYMKYIVQ